MKNVTYFECTICHKQYDKNLELMTCPSCGELGILEIVFDYDKIKKEVDANYFKHNHDYSIWRSTIFDSR